MNLKRCEWCEGTFEKYIEYHDNEWGVPNHDDQKHFEFLTLEGAQAGLSWATILNKREGYRKAFLDYDVERLAKMDQNYLIALQNNTSIVRNKLKIASVAINASKFIEIQNEYGTFDAYVWQFVDGKPIQNQRKNLAEVPSSTKQSNNLSKDLKKRGFKFVGTTIVYAFMQAMGLVNDHTIDCYRYQEVSSLS